jgi:hypothetical protein
MKNLRWMLPGLALAALLGNGCIIISTQIFTHFALDNPISINPPGTPVYWQPVDLNTVSDYSSNVAKLKGLSDIGILGTFTNLSGPGGEVEVWITPGATHFTTYAGVIAGATLMWKNSVGAAPATKVVDWKESSASFKAAGKTILIDEVLHGGVFTLYIVSSGNVANQFKVDNGVVELVISAAK